MISKEYIAGFFDGEGCVCIKPNGLSSNNFILDVSITQKDPMILGWILLQYPEGNIRKNGTTFKFVLTSKNAERFLNDMKDLCIFKGPQMILALEFLARVGKPGGRTGEEENKVRREIYLKLREMKVYTPNI